MFWMPDQVRHDVPGTFYAFISIGFDDNSANHSGKVFIMSLPATMIDSHVHLDLIVRHHPHRIQWLMDKGCGVVSWAYFEGVQSVSHFKECLEAKARCIHEQSASGLRCHFLVGVHPRSIPPDLKPEQVKGLLEAHLQDHLCLGIGEIGLETGNAQEKEVLLAQLELGRSLITRGAVVGVHTPRSNKPAITQTTLDLLRGFSDLADTLVVDHCTDDTIGAVLDAGFWAGVTLSTVKTSWDGLKQIVADEAKRIERIMVNTDSGTEFFEDLVRGRQNEDFPENIRERLFEGTAAQFFAFPDRMG